MEIKAPSFYFHILYRKSPLTPGVASRMRLARPACKWPVMTVIGNILAIVLLTCGLGYYIEELHLSAWMTCKGCHLLFGVI